MANTRAILKEESEKTVNEVQLKDLNDAASKVEIAIINLSTMAANFSNKEIINIASALRAKAHELTTSITAAMNPGAAPLATNAPEPSPEEQPSLEAQPLGDEEQMPLDQAPPDEKMIESVMGDLPGAEGNMNESEIVKGLMLFGKFKLQEAKKMVKEGLGKKVLRSIMERVFDSSNGDRTLAVHNPGGRENHQMTRPIEGFNNEEDSAAFEALTDMDEEGMFDKNGYVHPDNYADHEMLDLAEAFAIAQGGLNASHLNVFRDLVIEALSDKHAKLTESFKKAQNVKEMSKAVDGLYEYADANNIVIKSN